MFPSDTDNFGAPSEGQRINYSVHGRYLIYYNDRRPDVKYPSYYSPFAHYGLCELEVNGVYSITECPISTEIDKSLSISGKYYLS